MSNVIPVIIGALIVLNSTNAVTYITDPRSPYVGYPYEWRLQLNLTVVGNSLPYGAFDSTFIKKGQWIAVSNGMTYMIINVESPITQTDIFVTVRDVDLYNLELDTSNSQSNTPVENVPGIIFSLSEDGIPSISDTTILSAIGTWIQDSIGRFTFRNYYEEFYTNFNLDVSYYGFSVGQVVYIGNSNGIYQYLPVDLTNTTDVDNAFGIVTSIDWPQTGNMNVRPFGKVITILPYNLPGNIGDALYYSPTNPPSFCTNIKPTTNPLKIYIKLDTNVASVLYGQSSGQASSADTTFPNSYENNGINVVVPTSGYGLTIGDGITLSKACNVWISVSLNYISTDTNSNIIEAFATINGKTSNMYTSTISGTIRMIIPGYLQFSFQHYAYCNAGYNQIYVTTTCPSNTGLVKLQEYNIFALGNL